MGCRVALWPSGKIWPMKHWPSKRTEKMTESARSPIAVSFGVSSMSALLNPLSTSDWIMIEPSTIW
jgi:hypothetical protein